MPVELRWHTPNPNRIILQRFYGEVALEDITYASTEGPRMMLDGIPPVHLFVEGSGVTRFPQQLRSLQEALRANPNPEVLGWVVIVTPDNPLLRFIAAMLAQLKINHVRFRLFLDAEAALRFLHTQDPTLTQNSTPLN